MESERLCIRLDNPERIFYAGQVIRGEIWMNLNKRTKIRGKIVIILVIICYFTTRVCIMSESGPARPQFAVSSEVF